jgi:hypothetical protein
MTGQSVETYKALTILERLAFIDVHNQAHRR